MARDSKKEWQRAASWTHAMQLQHKKESELVAINAGIELPKPKPDRLKIEDGYTRIALRNLYHFVRAVRFLALNSATHPAMCIVCSSKCTLSPASRSDCRSDKLLKIPFAL
jgi:hypothetical protein